MGVAPTLTDLTAAMNRLHLLALLAVERAAREYAAHSHGNMVGEHYRAREEARDKLLDALSQLDAVRGR
jgi:hypothetical protein